MAIWIDAEKCNGCGLCTMACPYGGVHVGSEGKAALSERCTECGACVEVCQFEALLSDGAEREVPDFGDRVGVWVLAEQEGGLLHPVTRELLGKARALADELGQEVGAVLLGHEVAPLGAELIAAGADTVQLVEHPLLSRYLTRPLTTAAARVVSGLKPNILLVGATSQGRDLAPRLARRLGVGLTADCTGLEIDPEERLLKQIRPAFGGNVLATIVGRYSRPQMATVRPGIMKPLPPDSRRRGEVVRHQVDLAEDGLGALLLERLDADGQAVDLTRAKVVVAGGRGVGDASGFALLEELARALGGEVGGTRVAVEEGWIPQERQIGQTGVTVRPALYVACGISGAIQHRAGMLESRTIVAINKDQGAPIFEVADFGLVGDYRSIVGALIKAVRGG